MIGSNNFQPVLTSTEVISLPFIHRWLKSETSIAAESFVSNGPEMKSSAYQIMASHYSVVSYSLDSYKKMYLIALSESHHALLLTCANFTYVYFLPTQ